MAERDGLDHHLRVSRAVALALACLVLSLGAAMILAALADPPYSPDSWTYWDLAQSLAATPYRISVLRAYQTTLPWSNAFPPLWPALNALVAAALDSGPVTLLITNAAVLALFAWACAAASRTVFGVTGPGLLSVLAMLGDAGFREELLAGRPIPMQMTLMAALIAVLAAPAPRYAVAGLLCGLLLATKFDISPLVAVVGLFLLARPGRRSLPLFLFCAILPPLPWAVFSLVHFGQLYASDGSAIAASVDPAAFTTDFRPSWSPTLRDDPAAWRRKVWLHLHETYWELRRSWSAAEGLAVAAGLLAMPWAGLRARHASVLLVMAAGLAASLASYVVTGFTDSRYFAPLRWLGCLAGFGLAWLALARMDARAVLVATMVTAAALAWRPLHSLPPLPWPLHPQRAFTSPAEIAALEACLARLPPGRVLFLDDDTAAARFGALTGRLAGMTPRNLDRLDHAEVNTFLSRYGFAIVTWSMAQGRSRADRIGIETPTCGRVAAIAATRP